jgi:hypothetical protein
MEVFVPGKMRELIDKILAHQQKTYAAAVPSTRAKMMLKGINPDQVTAQTEDDPRKVAELEKLAQSLQIPL